MRRSMVLVPATIAAAAAIAAMTIAPQTDPANTFPLQFAAPAAAKPPKKETGEGCTLRQQASSAFKSCVKHGQKDKKQGKVYTHRPICASTGVVCCARFNDTGEIASCYAPEARQPSRLPPSLNPEDGTTWQPPPGVPPKGRLTPDAGVAPPKGPPLKPGGGFGSSGTKHVSPPPPSGTILRGGKR
jgi:hypothetical protein